MAAEPLPEVPEAPEQHEHTISAEEAQALRAQISKWQARLPKLAAAMRQRSEALAAARVEIRALKREAQRLRDERLEEAAPASRASELQRELKTVRAAAGREVASLEARNRHLFEALQITNTQLERLGTSLKDLHRALDDREAQVDALTSALEAAEHEVQQSRAAAAPGLTRIKGIGAKTAEQLAGAGVCAVRDLAALDVDSLDDASHPLHGLRARIRRERWVEQAQLLGEPTP